MRRISQAGARALLVTRIEPHRGWISLHLREVWEYRELLFFLVWRDVKVRYKQTVLGALWAVLQPVLSMVVFTLIFGRLARLQSDGLPYSVWNLAAMIVWTYFSSGLSNSSNSLVGSSNLIRKVYFPRLAIPIATVLSPVVDFLIAFVVLLGMMAWFGITPGLQALWALPLLLLALVTALGVGFWLSALNVKYRDVRYTIPFLTQIWLFATPVVYSSSIVPAAWRPLYALNPMVGVIEGFRWALLGADTRPGPMILASSLAALLLLVSGAYYFRRMEKTFADVV